MTTITCVAAAVTKRRKNAEGKTAALRTCRFVLFGLPASARAAAHSARRRHLVIIIVALFEEDVAAFARSGNTASGVAASLPVWHHRAHAYISPSLSTPKTLLYVACIPLLRIDFLFALAPAYNALSHAILYLYQQNGTYCGRRHMYAWPLP